MSSVSGDKKPSGRRLRIIPDTCFWITLAGLDLISVNPTEKERRQTEERMGLAERTFEYILANSDRMEIVMTRFTQGELNRTMQKILTEAKNIWNYSPERIEKLEKVCRELELDIVRKTTFVDLDSWSFIERNNDLPLPPTPDPENPDRLRKNPDRHFFAIARMMKRIPGGMDGSIILTFDKNHVASAGKDRENYPVEPGDFRDTAEMILYRNERRYEDAVREFRNMESRSPVPSSRLASRADTLLYEKLRDILLNEKFEKNRASEIEQAEKDLGIGTDSCMMM